MERSDGPNVTLDADGSIEIERSRGGARFGFNPEDGAVRLKINGVDRVERPGGPNVTTNMARPFQIGWFARKLGFGLSPENVARVGSNGTRLGLTMSLGFESLQCQMA